MYSKDIPGMFAILVHASINLYLSSKSSHYQGTALFSHKNVWVSTKILKVGVMHTTSSWRWLGPWKTFFFTFFSFSALVREEKKYFVHHSSWNVQFPPKESIHFCRAEYSKLRGARWKVGGAPNPPLSWSKLGQASFWISKKWLHLFLCRHLLEFQNEAWSSLDQLNGRCGAPPTFSLAPLDFEYLALLQVYTFFRWRL